MRKLQKTKRMAVLMTALTLCSPAVQAQPDPLAGLQQSAENGDLNAQVILGRMYFDGIGIPVNRQEALKWNLKAADRGSPEALILVAMAYTDGAYPTTDLPPSGGYPINKFHQLMEQARGMALERAAKGDAAAMYVVAMADYYKRDEQSAFKPEADAFIRRSAEQGYIPAESELSRIISNGYPSDQKAELEWAMKAAKQGDSEAMFQVGMVYKRMHDDANARSWLVKSAELNNIDGVQWACINYGIRIGSFPDWAYKDCGRGHADHPEDGAQLDSSVKIGLGIFLGSIIVGLLTQDPNQTPDQRREATRRYNAFTDKQRCEANARQAEANGLVSMSCDWIH